MSAAFVTRCRPGGFDLDCVDGRSRDGGGAVGRVAVLRRQRDLSGADFLTIEARATQWSMTAVELICLVHRGGDVGCGEFDADVRGQGVRDPLYLPRTHHGDLTRVDPGRRRAVGITARQGGDSCSGSSQKESICGKTRWISPCLPTLARLWSQKGRILRQGCHDRFVRDPVFWGVLPALGDRSPSAVGTGAG